MNLESERLVIRKIYERDWDDFYEYRSDPKVCEFQSYEPIKKEDSAKFIAELKDTEFGNAGEWIQLAVELKSEKKMIGDIGLKPESGNAQVVEFGISFSTKYQKQGLAKEALTLVFKHLFSEKNIHRIIGIMDVKNVSMIGLIESLKFRREAEFRESFWDEREKDWCNEFLYAMLKKDWEIDKNESPILIELNAEFKERFLEMAKDYQSAGDDRYQSAADDFEAFLESLEMYRTGKNLPAHLVRANSFFLFNDNKLIGRGDLRHQLNDHLAVMGGHIGYDVRPSERRKGYGSLILQLTLEKASSIELEKVFLTCDTDNIASAKIIEKNGGKLHTQIFYKPKGKLISQYWIEL